VLRLGQSYEALGQFDAAARAYSAAATTYRSVPFARVLGHAYAANMRQHLNQFDRALTERQAALAGWDLDYGLTYALDEFHPRLPGDDGGTPQLREVVREELADEAERLQRSLQRREGSLVERGRWSVLHGAFREGLGPLRTVLAGGGSPEVVSAARYWERRAQVGIALQLAAADNPARRGDEALKELAIAASGPYDFGVFMAEAARASLLWQNGSSADAELALRAALSRWDNSQRELRDAPRADLEPDIAAIRELILRPPGGNALRWATGEAFGYQGTLVIDPEVRVRLVDQASRRVTVYQPFSGPEHVLFLTDEQRTALGAIVTSLDGAEYQSRAALGGPAPETSNQRRPAVRPFWDRFFPAAPWRQTPGESAPTITELEFLNAERTKAAARIQGDHQGATMMLEKVDGIWRIVEVVDSWIS
jgi:hypothetical protein